MSIKSTGSDHELELYSRSLVDHHGERQLLTGSYSGTSIDYIVVDGNHWPSSDQEQYLIYNFSGDGGYYSNWSNQGHCFIHLVSTVLMPLDQMVRLRCLIFPFPDTRHTNS